jgi:cytochrome P450 family 142 subfamily A polypeptide 1
MPSGVLPQIDLLNGYLYASDPTPTYAWLRSEAPVYRDDINNLWGVSRHADIVAIEKAPGRYSNRNAYRPITVHDPEGDLSMINFDDPRHYQQRRMVNRSFTPKAVGKHEELVQEQVTALVDAVVADGSCDVVEQLAAPLPAMMIAHYLGFGMDRWQEVKHWSEATIPLGGGDRYLNETVLEEVFGFAGAVVELIEQRRAEPREDMISVWLNSEIDGRPMTDAEIVSECLLLVDGGAETTRTVIANTMWALCTYPDQRARLIENPELLETTAVEEFIRWTSPILNMSRVVTQDHELHGARLSVGDKVLLMYSSANRDESVFANADRFDVTRNPNPHLSFGFGTHFCLGASLARLELRLMFRELLRRIPDWELEGAPPTLVPGAFVRGINNYRVRFTPTRPSE